jgi:hypothetical protein
VVEEETEKTDMAEDGLEEAVRGPWADGRRSARQGSTTVLVIRVTSRAVIDNHVEGRGLFDCLYTFLSHAPRPFRTSQSRGLRGLSSRLFLFGEGGRDITFWETSENISLKLSNPGRRFVSPLLEGGLQVGGAVGRSRIMRK